MCFMFIEARVLLQCHENILPRPAQIYYRGITLVCASIAVDDTDACNDTDSTFSLVLFLNNRAP